jgi:hypothetical protein
MRTLFAGAIGALLFALHGAAVAQTSPGAERGKAPSRESAPSLRGGKNGGRIKADTEAGSAAGGSAGR